MSLERLRELPLTAEARLALLRELRASPQPPEQLLPLTGEMAEVTLRCCEDAYQASQWLEEDVCRHLSEEEVNFLRMNA